MKTMMITVAAMLAWLSLPAQEWTLSRCIDHALAHNIAVKQGEIEVLQAENELDASISSRLPSVSASASQNYSFGRGLSADNTYVNNNTGSTGLSIGTGINLFNGFRTENGIRLSRLSLEASTADLEKARNDIRVAVAQAFMQVLYDMEIVEVAARQVEIDSLQVQRMEMLYRNGKTGAAELAAQKASLSQSLYTKVQASNNLTIGLLSLTQLLELESPENFRIARPPATAKPIPASPDEIFHMAESGRPEIKAEAIRLEGAGMRVKIAKGAFLPSLSLSGGIGSNAYSSTGYQAPSFFTQLGNNFSQYVGLSLNIPIFTAYSTRKSVRGALLQEENQRLVLDNARKNLYKEIQQAWYNAVTSRSKCMSSQAALEAAEESFSLQKAKYENGKCAITEFIEARNALMKAQSDLAQAKYESLFQSALLQFYAEGRLDL